MRTRLTVTVGLLVLVPAVLTGAGQILPSATNAAVSAQVGMMQAAIHSGSCANPAPIPFALLNDLTPSGEADNAAAPLASNTEAQVAFDNLLATPHAILVTLGGDVDALLACGDLGDQIQPGTLTVELQEENDSGYAGVALLTAAGDTTRVSLLLAEVPQLPPVAATPTTRAPTIPAAIATPAIATPAATPSPTGGQGSPYVSEQFGYAIAFAAPWQIVYGPQVDATNDYIVLADGTSFVDFLGLVQPLTAPQCMDRLYNDFILNIPGLTLVVPHTVSEATVSTPQEAVEVWDVSYVDENRQRVDKTYYARCIVLQPGQSVLLTTQLAPRGDYTAEAALREELYQGLTLPQ
jgi:hypothetical protein